MQILIYCHGRFVAKWYDRRLSVEYSRNYDFQHPAKFKTTFSEHVLLAQVKVLQTIRKFHRTKPSCAAKFNEKAPARVCSRVGMINVICFMFLPQVVDCGGGTSTERWWWHHAGVFFLSAVWEHLKNLASDSFSAAITMTTESFYFLFGIGISNFELCSAAA